MEYEKPRLKEMRGKAQRRFDEILRMVSEGPSSLLQLLVKAYREGHEPEKAYVAFAALREAVEDAELVYRAAIAQPQARIVKKRVEL
jgi:hypothetical protein